MATLADTVCKYCKQAGHERRTCLHLKVEHDASECEVCQQKQRRNISSKSSKSFYATERYWEARYTTASAADVGVERNEWFVDWSLVQPCFARFLPDPPCTLKVLDVGCGLSALPFAISSAQYGHVTGVDVSASAIRGMSEKYAGNDRLSFLQMDAREMSFFVDGAFDVTVDKGTVDAMLTGEDDSAKDSLGIKSPEIIQVLKEIYRVTNNVFFLITHSNDRKRLLADVGFEVMKMEQLKNNLRDYYLYFCIKDINATLFKSAMEEARALDVTIQ